MGNQNDIVPQDSKKKSKKKLIIGGAVTVLIIAAIIFGSTSNYFGAFTINRGGGAADDGVGVIETAGLVNEDDGGSDMDMSGKDNNALGTGVPYVQTVDFNGEIDFFDPTELYRFKISAIEGNATVYYVGFDFYEEGLEIEDVYVIAYGDDTVLGEMRYSSQSNLIYGALDEVDDGVSIFDGQDKTFSLMANLDRDYDDDYINSETRFGNSTSPYCVGPDTFANVFDEVNLDLGMIWTPRVNKDVDDSVWLNDGCGVEGLNMALFEIEKL